MWLFCAGFQEVREKLVTLLAEEIVRLNKSGKAGEGSDYVIAYCYSLKHILLVLKLILLVEL